VDSAGPPGAERGLGRRIRVVLVGPYPATAGRPAGGVETAFLNLLDGLAALQEVDAHVATFVPGLASDELVMHGQIPVYRLPGRRRMNNLTLYRSNRLSLARTLDRLQPDLVHAQDAVGNGYISLRASRVPVVVSIHGIVREEPKQLERLSDRLRTRIARVAVERYCIRHAMFLAAPTPYPERYFGSEIRGQIVDVGNAVAERFFSVVPDPVPGRMLYVGGITRGKRLLDLVEALAFVRSALPGPTLRVAGPPVDAAYANAVRRRVRELELDPCVEFLGPCDVTTLLEEYRRASVVVLPSAQETSPMVIAEAMAAGVPVVATRVGGIPWLVSDRETGFLVDVGDVEALGRRVAEALGDGEMRARLAAAGRAAARERFRPIDVATRALGLYRLTQDRPAAAGAAHVERIP
jgi:glycosyltransferase involved in cell wall biosynthesis